MSRQLTALEKYRITGVHDAREQLAIFERLGIPATTRVSMGNYVIECVAHTNAVRDCINEAQWSEIRDENIDTAGWLVNQPQAPHDQGSNNTDTAYQSTTHSVLSLNWCCLEERVSKQLRQA